jgi:hypothetical protein
MLRSVRLSVGALSVLALGILCASGCGPGHKDRGVVRGKVTFNGKPLNSGTILFVTSDNRSASTSIKEDGTYEMPDAPVGECTITVTVGSTSGKGGGNMMAPGGMPAIGKMGGPGGMPSTTGGQKSDSSKPPPGLGTSGGDGQQMTGPPPQVDARKQVKIPDKYSNPETSGLKYTVVKGEQTKDLPLAP